VKHRSDASRLIEEGRVRLNKVRVAKLSQNVKPGDVLTITVGSHVSVVKVVAEPERRGPASAASLCYENIGE
jgi:ribosome-associated heat shock protein Hsp15